MLFDFGQTPVTDITLGQLLDQVTDRVFLTKLVVLVGPLLVWRVVLARLIRPAPPAFSWPAPEVWSTVYSQTVKAKVDVVGSRAGMDWTSGQKPITGLSHSGQIPDASRGWTDGLRPTIPDMLRPLNCCEHHTDLYWALCLTQRGLTSQYHLATIPLLSASGIQSQIQRAHDAQPRWAQTTIAQRQRVLSSLRAWVLRDMDAICRVACRDTGKTRESRSYRCKSYQLNIGQVSMRSWERS